MLDFNVSWTCPKCGYINTDGEAITEYRWEMNIGPCLIVNCNRCKFSENMRCKDEQEKIDA